MAKTVTITPDMFDGPHNAEPGVVRGKLREETVVAPEVVTDDAPMTVEYAAELLANEVCNSTVTLHQGELESTNLVAEAFGALQHGEMVETASRIANLYRIKQIKTHKAYKGARVPHKKTGKYVSVNTWEELCDAWGKDRKLIEEDLKNLATFGDNLIRLQDSLGIGYRELRKIRAGLLELSPEEQQEALIRLSGAEDKEEAYALVDEMQIKLATAEKEKAELKETLTTREALAEKTAKARDKAELKLEKMLKLQKDNPEKFTAEQEKETGKALAEAIALATGEMQRVTNICAGVYAEEGVSPDFVEHVNNQIASMCSRFHNMLLDAGVDVDFGAVFDPENVGTEAE